MDTILGIPLVKATAVSVRLRIYLCALKYTNNEQARKSAYHFLNASNNEDAVVDEVSLVGFYLFFYCLGCLA